MQLSLSFLIGNVDVENDTFSGIISIIEPNLLDISICFANIEHNSQLCNEIILTFHIFQISRITKSCIEEVESKMQAVSSKSNLR